MKKRVKTRFCYTPKLHISTRQCVLSSETKKLSEISSTAAPEVMAAAVLAYKLCNDFESFKKELLLLQNIIFTAAKPKTSKQVIGNKKRRQVFT